ncbi:hypothetical protein Bca101_001679 [Brassica carinata]
MRVKANLINFKSKLSNHATDLVNLTLFSFYLRLELPQMLLVGFISQTIQTRVSKGTKRG